jgi:hypothetical protein
MPGETLEIVGRGVGAKVVEEEEGISSFRTLKTEGPPQVDAGAFPRWHTGADTLNRAYCGHDFSPFLMH